MKYKSVKIRNYKDDTANSLVSDVVSPKPFRAAPEYQQLTELKSSIWTDLLWFSSFLVPYLWFVGGHVGVLIETKTRCCLTLFHTQCFIRNKVPSESFVGGTENEDVASQHHRYHTQQSDNMLVNWEDVAETSTSSLVPYVLLMFLKRGVPWGLQDNIIFI